VKDNGLLYRQLGGQAIVYGLGNIIPRILNYAILTAYYTRRFSVAEYGIITELYAYVSIMLVVLTYGMETGLFRYSSIKNNKDEVFSSISGSVIITSIIFLLIVTAFRDNIADFVGYRENVDYIIIMAVILATDSIGAIFFARLRSEDKVKKFAIYKILNVLFTVVFVLFFLEIVPLSSFLSNVIVLGIKLGDYGVGFILLSNLLASCIILAFLFSEKRPKASHFKIKLLKEVLFYSIPLLFAGLAGMFNEAIDRILLKNFVDNSLNPLYEIGIYGANYRIAVLMTIFIQMFRYAAEPFFFRVFSKGNDNSVYADVLKYLTIFMMIIFLIVGLYIDIFKFFIDPKFHEGLGIVPIILLANIFTGMLFNINMWYKLTGKTLYGLYITGIGAIITIVFNIVFIPLYSYHASAWIHVASNFVMLALTYYFGQRNFFIPYDLKKIILYMLIGFGIFGIFKLVETESFWCNFTIASVLILLYVLYCNKKERLIEIFLKKHESKNN